MLTESVYKTPLDCEHRALNAKMVEFAGWQMPLQYEGILQEFDYNRKTVSIFDCSHMGEFIVEGNLQTSGLDRIVTQALADMPVKACRYGTMLNENGGVIDDLIVYKITDDKWMIVVNASNIEKDREHFKKHLSKTARFLDVSMQTAKLDLQGPLSRDVLTQMVPDIKKLEYYCFDEFNLLGEKVIISRTGYTGELGYEIYYPWTKVKELWKEILNNVNVRPTGLGVRDVLRIEMCYPLYGHELDESITPLEAGLKKFVDLTKDFIGKEALVKLGQGNGRKAVYFTSESRRSPRSHHGLFLSDGKPIGSVTSGTFSPALGCGIGIGLVNDGGIKAGDKIMFGDQKNVNPAVVATRPFYKQGTLRN